ncbi:MAG: LLM class F420-dependent oxidoreductase [Acidimicrobiia bacterium]
MKLATGFGYWAGLPPEHAVEHLQEAERLGYDIAFTAETWGSDAFTPLAWWGAHTERIRLGTSIVQMAARTPAACAMSALTLDHLCDGRFSLGLGLSGPQVVEGWYGQPFARPLERTREYVGIIRDILARDEPVTNDGPHFPLPYDGPGALGLGKPLKSMVHPLRHDLPILLGSEGPKNVALTAEIADGWLPLYMGAHTAHVWRRWLEEGWARPGARRGPDDFEIIGGSIVVTDDRRAAMDAMKPNIAFYIGGMGAKDVNFHKDAFSRLGWESEAEEIQTLFLDGRRADATALVTDEMVLDQGIIGNAAEIRAELPRWAEAGFTTMRVRGGGIDDLRIAAEVVLGA